MLAAMMLLAMVACGNNNSEPTPEPTPTPDETKTLYMATEGTFPPYEYYDGDKLVGIDVEVAGAIAEKLGMELEVTDIAFDSIIPGVQTGKYDMGMAGMTVTDERKEQVNFSDSYSTGIQVVIVKEGGKVQSLDDMGAEGVIIGTQSGTTGFTYASSDFGDEKVKGFTKTTDHTREYVPLLVAGPEVKKDNNLGTVLGFGAIGKTICTALGVDAKLDGQDLAAKIFD